MMRDATTKRRLPLQAQMCIEGENFEDKEISECKCGRVHAAVHAYPWKSIDWARLYSWRKLSQSTLVARNVTRIITHPVVLHSFFDNRFMKDIFLCINTYKRFKRPSSKIVLKPFPLQYLYTYLFSRIITMLIWCRLVY